MQQRAPQRRPCQVSGPVTTATKLLVAIEPRDALGGRPSQAEGAVRSAAERRSSAAPARDGAAQAPAARKARRGFRPRMLSLQQRACEGDAEVTDDQMLVEMRQKLAAAQRRILRRLCAQYEQAAEQGKRLPGMRRVSTETLARARTSLELESDALLGRPASLGEASGPPTERRRSPTGEKEA